MELGPFWGGDLGTSWSTKHSFLIGDRQLPETPVSASSHLVSLPSWSLGPQFPYSSNGLSFAFSFTIPFSLSWNTLLLCLSSHLSVLSFQESGHQAATASLLSACDSMSLWLAMAHLHGWQAVVGEACLAPCRLWSSRHSGTGDLWACQRFKSHIM